jgi:hypothetical protein
MYEEEQEEEDDKVTNLLPAKAFEMSTTYLKAKAMVLSHSFVRKFALMLSILQLVLVSVCFVMRISPQD